MEMTDLLVYTHSLHVFLKDMSEHISIRNEKKGTLAYLYNSCG